MTSLLVLVMIEIPSLDSFCEQDDLCSLGIVDAFDLAMLLGRIHFHARSSGHTLHLLLTACLHFSYGCLYHVEHLEVRREQASSSSIC